MSVANRGAVAILLGVFLCGCARSQTASPDLNHHLRLLRTATDRAQLESSAVAVASSKNPRALSELRGLLASPEFLARLDDLASPQQKTYHLRRVMLAVEENPSPGAEKLCLALAADADFTADPARLNYLLPALAAVQPMSEPAANLFRRTSREGFFALNAPLLAANGSPRALAVFETMIADESVDPEERVDAVRRSVVPNRTALAVLESVGRLLGKKLEHRVAIALIESVFDYQPRPWFGPERTPPAPRRWESASPETLRLLLQLGRDVQARQDLSDSLRQAVAATLQRAAGLLQRRTP